MIQKGEVLEKNYLKKKLYQILNQKNYQKI